MQSSPPVNSTLPNPTFQNSTNQINNGENNVQKKTPKEKTPMCQVQYRHPFITGIFRHFYPHFPTFLRTGRFSDIFSFPKQKNLESLKNFPTFLRVTPNPSWHLSAVDRLGHLQFR